MAKSRTNKLSFVGITLVLAIAALFISSRLRPQNVSPIADGCSASDLSGRFDPTGQLGYFEGKLVRPQLQVAQAQAPTQVLAEYAPNEKWIEVDLSEQVLRAWEGEKIYLQTPVSTGLPWTPTPTGEFRIWIKLRYTRMQGGEGKYYYNLPNVPYVMFFENASTPAYLGYGLHGTYWHNDFGRTHSHGCVNLPTEMAGKLYEWVTPSTPNINYSAGKGFSDIGTRIVIHD